MQLFPAFMLGLLSPTLFHPWSMASGAMAGMLATIILEVIMTQDQDLADYAVSFVFTYAQLLVHDKICSNL